jgi:glycerophosphoryl diester phosphodiesterase
VPVPRLLTWDGPGDPPDRLLAEVEPHAVNPRHRLLSADRIAAWHDRGLAVCTWTVDFARRRRQLLAWGVDAVISNDVSGTVRDVAERRAATTGG